MGVAEGVGLGLTALGTGGALMGDKGGSSSSGASLYDQAAADIAKKMYWSTYPSRVSMLNSFNKFMRGGNIADAYSPVYNAERSALESGYGQARSNIIASLPRGGQLQDTLANLEVGRANQLGQLRGDLAMDMYNKIYGAVMGVPQQTASTLASIGSSVGNRELASDVADQNSQNTLYGLLGNLGLGVGMMMGGKKSGNNGTK